MTTISSEQTPRREPPSPPGDWWFGHLLPMRDNPTAFLAQTAQAYGGIVKLRFRKDIVYLVSEPELIKELLIDHGSKYRKNTRYKHLQRVLGQGLLLSEGDEWKKQRKVAQPFFTPAGVTARIDHTIEIARHFTARWKTFAENGQAIDTEEQFSLMAQQQSLRFIVGSLYEQQADTIARHMEVAKNTWPKPARGRFASLKPPPVWRMLKLKQAIEAVDACFYAYIDAYRRDKPQDAGMMHALVEAQDESWSLQRRNQQLRDQMVTLFLAGYETSASGLCWLFYLLDQHPEVRDKVYEEIDRELAGNEPTVQDLQRLTYLDKVISESLRLYSPIHSLSRVALEDDTIGGCYIPAGSTMMVSLYATHRLPNHWPDPERFDPERFAPEQIKARHRYAYIPFAVGHRNCIGGFQAIINAKINTVAIAQRYTLSLVPGHKVEMDPRTTMRPRYGMMMHLHAR